MIHVGGNVKRGTPRHPKVLALASRLKIPQYAAVGLLEMLWHFTAEFAHAGDVGRFDDDSISRALCWDGASTELVSCLVDTGWLDRCDCHRLRVHDWPDHADQTVERVLAKRGQGFAKCYDNASMKLGSSQHETSQPSPKANSLSPSPKANTKAPPDGGSVGDVADPLMDIPAELATPEFTAKWRVWINVRRGLKKPKSWPVLFNEQLLWLKQFPSNVAIEILSASIRNGWTGLFEPKNGSRVAAQKEPGTYKDDIKPKILDWAK